MFNFFKKYDCKNEKFYITIIETIRNSLDINETKQKIVDIIGKTMKADRCFIAEYDKENDKFLIMIDEYLGSNDIVSYKGIDLNKEFPNAIDIIKKGENIIINNKEFSANINSENFCQENEAIKKYKVLSLFAFPLYYFDELLGVLSISYLKKKHAVSDDEINMLNAIANQISTAIYHAGLFERTKKQAEREQAVRKIIDIVRSSLDIEEIKNKFVTEVGKYFNADRCFIYEYGENIKSGIYVEYTSSPEVKRMSKGDFSKPQYKYWEEAMFNTDLNTGTFIWDHEQFIIDNNLQNTPTDEHRKEFNIKTAIGVPIIYYNRLYGELIIQFTDKVVRLSNQDQEFIKILANQASIAFHQAEHFEKAQTKAKNEKTLREIMLSSVSTFDVQKIIKSIVTKAGKLFKADRCFFIEIDTETNKNLPLQDYAEYLASEDILSPTTRKPPTIDETGDFVQRTKQKLCEYSNDITKEKLPESTKKLLIDYLSVKSYLNVPVFYGDILYGSMVFHYVHDFKQFTQEDIDMAVAIANQSAIVLHRTELFEKTKVQAERERVLRQITNKIRSSLDIEKILYFICEEIAKLFNVQRVSIPTYPDQNNYEKYIIKHEYVASPNIKTYPTAGDALKTAAYWGEILTKSQEVIAFDNIEESDAPAFFKNTYKDLGVMANMGTSIRKGKDIWGCIILSELRNSRHWSDEEKTLLKTIADQVYIATTQAELYSITKLQAEREVLLRKITFTIRTSLDLEETFNLICSEIGKITGANRVAIVEMIEKYSKDTIRGEFKTSESIIGVRDIEFEREKVFGYLTTSVFGKNEPLIINNTEGPDIPEFIKDFYRALNVKSVTIFPIRKEKDEWGILTISYVNEYKSWTESEINFLETILEQIYIAIKQAKLYEEQKLMAERERISLNIIEILRSSINKTIIKKLFVKNIGKFFDAGRVLLSEYDAIEKRYLPADENSEYLSSPQQQSLIGYDWTSSEVSEFIQPLLEKRELNIFCWDEYIQQNQKGQDFIDFFESYNIKSSYNFPIIYQQNIMGFFCIDFMNEVRRLSNEDINRARNMCTQAGVALYHATLYEKAQECFQSRKSIISEFSKQINEPTNEILDTSILLSKNEFERTIQIEYLNTIINACHQLLELTKDISEY